jgi:dTDP-4-dehydrorhamnose 3,5-epimerase
VRVTRGAVFDVAVDLRTNSPTFGQWSGEFLSEDSMRMLWVPPGFAHGFLVTSDAADFQYKCTNFYAPEFERSIHWSDKDLLIDWPLGSDEELMVSQKDRQAVSFLQAEKYDE